MWQWESMYIPILYARACGDVPACEARSGFYYPKRLDIETDMGNPEKVIGLIIAGSLR
jgi:hypothetical protein